MREFINSKNIPAIDELKIDVNKDKPAMQVVVDREKAGELRCKYRTSWPTIT